VYPLPMMEVTQRASIARTASAGRARVAPTTKPDHLRRMTPARKSQTIDIDIPPVKSAKDVPALIKAIWCAVRDGRVTPEEATALGLLLERSIQAFEAEELRRQVEALEQLEDVTP